MNSCLKFGRKLFTKSKEIAEKNRQTFRMKKINLFLSSAKSSMKSFIGAKFQDLHHYIVLPLDEQKPDVAVIHIGTIQER